METTRATAETITKDDREKVRNDLAAALGARPFRPFTLILEGGARLRARHPECFHVGDDGKLVVADDHNPGEASGLIVGVEIDPTPFGPIPRRRAKRHEVEAVLALAERFGAGHGEVKALAMGAGVGATWAGLRLAAAEGLDCLHCVRERAFQLAALRQEPGTLDKTWHPAVRMYAVLVWLNARVGEYQASNADLAAWADVPENIVSKTLKALIDARLVERVWEKPDTERGARKLRALDFAAGFADMTT